MYVLTGESCFNWWKYIYIYIYILEVYIMRIIYRQYYKRLNKNTTFNEIQIKLMHNITAWKDQINTKIIYINITYLFILWEMKYL